MSVPSKHPVTMETTKEKVESGHPCPYKVSHHIFQLNVYCQFLNYLSCTALLVVVCTLELITIISTVLFYTQKTQRNWD